VYGELRRKDGSELVADGWFALVSCCCKMVEPSMFALAKYESKLVGNAEYRQDDHCLIWVWDSGQRRIRSRY